MRETLESKRPLTTKWPETMRRPTPEEVQNAIQDGEKRIAELRKQQKNKIGAEDAEFRTTAFTI